jgi:hypothetical protein
MFGEGFTLANLDRMWVQVGITSGEIPWDGGQWRRTGRTSAAPGGKMSNGSPRGVIFSCAAATGAVGSVNGGTSALTPPRGLRMKELSRRWPSALSRLQLSGSSRSPAPSGAAATLHAPAPPPPELELLLLAICAAHSYGED